MILCTTTVVYNAFYLLNCLQFYIECLKPNYLCVVLRSEIPSGMCAKLRTPAASNNRDHASQSLLLLLARAMHIYFYSSRTSRSWWITQSTHAALERLQQL